MMACRLLARQGSKALLARCATARAVMSFSSPSSEPVGFVGLGNMGSPMAHNLLAKGHRLVVCDLVQSSVAELVQAGAEAAGSPAQVARQASTIITMLPAGEHVKEVYAGKDGVLSAVRKGSLLVDSSTINPKLATDMSKQASSCGATYIDAPVSGGTAAAKKGILTFMVGGEEEAFEKARDLLACMGRNVVHCGSSGNGQATKLCNNMMLAIEMIGTAEAMHVAIRLGLDPKVFTSIVNTASGRCWSSEVYNPCPGVMDSVPSSNNYEGGFGSALMAKDLTLVQKSVQDTGSYTPLGSLSHKIYKDICDKGFGKKDFSFVFKYLEKGN